MLVYSTCFTPYCCVFFPNNAVLDLLSFAPLSQLACKPQCNQAIIYVTLQSVNITGHSEKKTKKYACHDLTTCFSS